MSHGFVEQAVDVVFPGNVSDGRSQPRPRGRESRETVGVDIADMYLCTLVEKGLGHHPADTVGGRRDQGSLAGDLAHRASISARAS